MICRAFGRRWAESDDLRSLQEEMDRERRSAEPSGGDGQRAKICGAFRRRWAESTSLKGIRRGI